MKKLLLLLAFSLSTLTGYGQSFETSIEAVEAFEFEPTLLRLHPSVNYMTADTSTCVTDSLGVTLCDSIEVFDVQVYLKQDITNGVIEQSRKYTFPAAYKAAMSTYNTATMRAEINWQAISPLLQQFGLRIPE